MYSFIHSSYCAVNMDRSSVFHFIRSARFIECFHYVISFIRTNIIIDPFILFICPNLPFQTFHLAVHLPLSICFTHQNLFFPFIDFFYPSLPPPLCRGSESSHPLHSLIFSIFSILVTPSFPIPSFYISIHALFL